MRLISTLLLGWLMVVGAAAEPPIKAGDRIAIIGNTFADQLRVHGYLETLLLQHTRENPVSIRNLGWGGDMLSARDRPTGFQSEASTLTKHKTDVIIACFGMGESFASDDGLDVFKNQLNALISSHAGKQYNDKSEVRLILVSPIGCEDLGKLTPNRDTRNRDLKAYTLAMEEVAKGAQVPFVDLFEASLTLMDARVGPKLTTNGIHLNAYGYWAISHAFFDQLTSDDRVPDQPTWMIRIDAASKESDSRGGVRDLVTDESGLNFHTTEQLALKLPPPTADPLPATLDSVRDTLVVDKLEPGTYVLTIDQEPVAMATAAEWGVGVAVDSSPMHQAAEAYRAKVNDKNLQFAYSWKALNQVHIVGERKQSPSGKELPKEIIEFNTLAEESDAALREGIELRSRHWRLTRVQSPTN